MPDSMFIAVKLEDAFVNSQGLNPNGVLDPTTLQNTLCNDLWLEDTPNGLCLIKRHRTALRTTVSIVQILHVLG